VLLNVVAIGKMKAMRKSEESRTILSLRKQIRQQVSCHLQSHDLFEKELAVGQHDRRLAENEFRSATWIKRWERWKPVI